MHYSMVKPPCSVLRVITATFWVSESLGIYGMVIGFSFYDTMPRFLVLIPIFKEMQKPDKIIFTFTEKYAHLILANISPSFT